MFNFFINMGCFNVRGLRLVERNGFSSVFLLVGMLLMAVSLPVATNLVQKNQENRSNAAEAECETGETKCEGGYKYTCSGYKWKKSTITCGSSISCKTYTYSSWSICTNGKQTRTIVGRYPAGCSEMVSGSVAPVLSQSCKLIDGEVCSSNSDCSSNNCFSGKCRTKVDGVCGSDKYLCTKGDQYGAVETDKYYWYCHGLYGGLSSARCSASILSTTKLDDGKSCSSNSQCTSNNCYYGVCRKKITGYCGLTKNSCTSGTFSEVTDDSTHYLWKCLGSYGGETKSCSLVISTVDPTGITLSSGGVSNISTLTIYLGKSMSVTASVLPTDASDKTVKWESSNSSVATVSSSSGLTVSVTAVTSGTAIITAKTVNGKAATVKVVSGMCCPNNALSCDGKTTTTGQFEFRCSTSAPTGADGQSYQLADGNLACPLNGQKCYYGYKTVNTQTDGCTSANGICRSVCGSNEKIGGDSSGCRPAVCCVPSNNVKANGQCNSAYNNKTIGTRPTDSQACTKGGVSWVDPTGASGKFIWKCQGVNGGESVECMANVPTGSKAEETSTGCRDLGGVCATYSSAFSTSSSCMVTGYPLVGTVKTGLCKSGVTTVCCTGITGTDSGDSNSGDSGGGSSGGGSNNGDGSGSTPTATPTLISSDNGTDCDNISCCLLENDLLWDAAEGKCYKIIAKGPDIGNPVLPTFTPTPSITSVPTSVPTSTSTPTLTPTTVPALASKLNFKITFAGIKPNATCLSNLGNIIVEVGNRPTSVSQTLSGLSVTPVSGEVDTLGNQVFKVTDLSLDTTKFGSVDTANYVKVKGPFHSRRRMCLNNQSTKIDETTTCDIDLHRTDDFVYNFARYTLLAGDVNQDNVIDLVDFSKVKNALNPGSAVNCGLAYDLNLDGVVNSIDLSLIRDNALASVDDE